MTRTKPSRGRKPAPREKKVAPRLNKAASVLRRTADWPERLSRFLLEPGEPGWGKSDCCLFVCDGVRAMTGVDLAAGIRGAYSTEQEAKRVIARRGGFERMIECIAKAHAIEEVAVAMAQRGDVVLADTEAGPTLMLVDLNGRQIIGRTLDRAAGVARLALTMARRAWRIP